ncbi:MAG: NAD-dependent epimerase/dehydratase family protein [Elusimicrobia bacterium]|nr:NAD-dependent epimerase/dehydratase family protein [Elusimicrobiota bacterium]
MRALVTGAAGFIGSNLVAALAREGASVVGLDDFSVGNFENLRGFAGDVVAADVCDVAGWGRRAGKVDAVFHEAAITDTTVTDQLRMMRVNVESFRDLLEWAAQARVKTVVYASSAALYGDGAVPMREGARLNPLNIYAFSKRAMEAVAAGAQKRHPRMRIIGLRYFNVYGPGESFKGKAASMIWQLHQQMCAGLRPRIFEFGDQYRDFVYVKDVVAANRAALTRGRSGVYNVCTGLKTTFNQVVESLNKALGTRLAPDYFKNPYSFYQNETLGDPAAAQRGLGFKAAFGSGEGIEDYMRSAS